MNKENVVYKHNGVILSLKKEGNLGLGMVVHNCNLRYSGGRDQKDCGPRPYLKNNYSKKGLGYLVKW
jgi:hypothetical protein